MEVNANIADLNGDILIKTPDRDYRLNGKATIKVYNTYGQMKKTYLINPTHEQGEELSFCYDFLQQAYTYCCVFIVIILYFVRKCVQLNQSITSNASLFLIGW